MREVRVTTPKERAADVVRLALDAGLSQVTVYPVYVNGPDEPKETVSVNASTPQAKQFIDKLLAAPFFDTKQFCLTSRNIHAILTSQPENEITYPVYRPSVDVLQELWQHCHVTLSYCGRMFVATLLMAYGMMQNSLVILIAALLFTSFLPQTLGVGFGLSTRHWKLAARGALALAVGTTITVATGAVVAWLTGGPLRFEDFSSPLVNFLISVGVGVAAGFSTTDDVGERQVIGLAAASQFAKFPAWFGISLVLGLPEESVVLERTMTFFMNVTTMTGAAALTYTLLGMRSVDRGSTLAAGVHKNHPSTRETAGANGRASGRRKSRAHKSKRRRK